MTKVTIFFYQLFIFQDVLGKYHVVQLRKFILNNLQYEKVFPYFFPQRTRYHQKTNTIYCITCPVCQNNNIRKIDRNIITRLNEHVTRNDQPMFQQLKLCEKFLNITSMMSFPDIESKSPFVNFSEHIQTTVIDNSHC